MRMGWDGCGGGGGVGGGLFALRQSKGNKKGKSGGYHSGSGLSGDDVIKMD